MITSVMVRTPALRHKEIVAEFDKLSKRGSMISAGLVAELFSTFQGRESHGQYMNMRDILKIYAIDEDAVKHYAQYIYQDIATGGAYPTKALKLKKGSKELPSNWVSVHLEVWRYRSFGDSKQNGTFLLAEKCAVNALGYNNYNS